MHRSQFWKKTLGAALIFGAFAGQALAANPVLSLQSTPTPGVLGSNVAVDVLIAGISDLYGYQFSLSFDPALLHFSSASEGAFLSGGGSTFWNPGSVDNSLGQISFTFNSLIGSIPGVSGDGVLARFNFQVTGVGNSALNFSDVLLLNSQLAELPVQINNGSLATVNAVPEPSTWLMLGAGLAGLGLLRSRSKRPTEAAPA
ncbi:hypothetical protein HNP55_001970 [Paucibacter oligotrophus]|uniref:Secreted protein with PEP-CTERM sorting signal n=1 Tax=Roseateles oligotrophus TaxID=1769250 RepID=A0A840L6N1_9BURK|nr:cohesin domain-containing protein [Roseateles oligotrophus]MBB4843451.1 hypothetical protein [Roseateles oligotrophus]